VNKEYREGWESFYKAKGTYANPYKLNSQEFNDFERGWSQALKRCEEWRLKLYTNR